MSPFRVFGGLALAFGMLLLVIIVANLRTRGAGGHDLLPGTPFALLSVVIGIGLLLHRKWAAVLFAGALGITGLWLGIMSTVKVPMPWLILNVGLACVLLLPSAVVVRCWSQLNRK
jgi:hypothetical protein